MVADHTKFGRICSIFVAPVTAANVMITDFGIDPEMANELRALSIQDF